jgi:hypothetical protein
MTKLLNVIRKENPKLSAVFYKEGKQKQFLAFLDKEGIPADIGYDDEDVVVLFPHDSPNFEVYPDYWAVWETLDFVATYTDKEFRELFVEASCSVCKHRK